MAKDIFRASEIARICRTSRQTVNRWLNSGAIHGFRPTKTSDWRITRKDLLQFMKENSIPFDLLNEEEKIKVLVVDDEVNLANIIVRALRDDEGLLAEAANSGFTAGIKLENFKPDVVILDIFLGDMDGRELFEYIRQDPEHGDIKVIGITGMLDEDKIDDMLEDGFDGFLIKPFDIEALRNLIHETIGVSTARQKT